MFSKLVVVALYLAVANAAYTGPLAGGQPAAQYPAGVDPQSCPNYPICENPSVAVAASAYASPYQAQAQYAQPQYSQQQYAQPQYNPAAQYQLAQSRYTPSPVQQYNLGQSAPVQLQQRQYNLAQPQFTPNQAYNAAPQAAAQSQYPSHLQAALDRGEYIGDGDYHGEGLAESGAQAQGPAPQAYSPVAYQQAYSAQIPQQAYSAQSQQAYQAQPTAYQAQPAAYQAQPAAYQAAQPAAYHAAQQPAQLPAGLAPDACPNYPFCQQ